MFNIKTNSVNLSLEINSSLDNILLFNEKIKLYKDGFLDIFKAIIVSSDRFDIEFNIGRKFVFSKDNIDKIIQCYEQLENKEYDELNDKLILALTENNILLQSNVDKNTKKFMMFSELIKVSVDVLEFMSEDAIKTILGEFYTSDVTEHFKNFDLIDVLFKYDPILLTELNKDLVLGKIDISTYRNLVFINSKHKLFKYIYEFKRIKKQDQENPSETESTETPDSKNPQAKFTNDTTSMGSGLVRDFNPGHVQTKDELSPDERLRLELHSKRQKSLLKNKEYVNEFLNKGKGRQPIR